METISILLMQLTTEAWCHRMGVSHSELQDLTAMPEGTYNNLGLLVARNCMVSWGYLR